MNVGGSGNKVVGGAAGHDLEQDVRFSEAALEPALQQLEELRAALADHAGKVADIDQCNDAVDLIEEELNRDQPQRSRLKLVLGGLLGAIGSVPGVVDVFDKLQNAVNALFTT